MRSAGAWSRRLTAIALVALAAVACSEPIDPSLPSSLRELRKALPVRPGLNVIVVSFDALRPDALGAYGYERATSPRIDEFARRSVVFDRAYSVAPATPTSFAAAFTGMLPTRVFHAWRYVAESDVASRFSAAGYHTAGLFNSVQFTPERGFDRWFADYHWHNAKPHREFLADSVAWLESAPTPFFAWIHFLPPHAPYDRHEEFSHLYDETYEGPFKETSGQLFETDDPRDAARIRELYDGHVAYSDALFGGLLDQLERLGLTDDSVIVLTSDHGEEFQDHGAFQHGRLTEEHVRVPLIIHHPDLRRGVRSDLLTSNVDLMPTLLALVGEPVTDPLDGKNLLALDSEPDTVVGISMTGEFDRYLSLRKGPDKVILTCMPPPVRAELFDLETDPRELTDLAELDEPTTHGLLSDLETILGGPPCPTMEAAVRGTLETTGLAEETIEGLKAIGYLGN